MTANTTIPMNMIQLWDYCDWSASCVVAKHTKNQNSIHTEGVQHLRHHNRLVQTGLGCIIYHFVWAVLWTRCRFLETKKIGVWKH